MCKSDSSQGRGNSPFWYEYGQTVGGIWESPNTYLGTPYSSHIRWPLPSPNGLCFTPSTSKYAMFSTTATHGTLNFENIRTPFSTSMNASFCGVVTTTAAVIEITWQSVSC